ncbi:PQQ-dependent sugar dehydrogenase [Halovenus salina]|uniref:PQQ-dependent sugar dehydrogenase n=1 Tax=Halovenus salina TaxID=1510225 RepID=UPI002260B5F2|nr:PQQ-dependent sugar dehydrogenase [Halovenus salina]
MDDRVRRTTRRAALLGFVGALGTVAGCLGDDGASTPSGGTPTGETPTSGGSDTPNATATHEFAVETVTEAVDAPWGMSFLPRESQLLVTERGGRLSLIDHETGELTPVDGAPAVFAGGQGGLLDVTLHPDFPDPSWVYLTYSVANDQSETATALGRGRLRVDSASLEDFERLHVAEPYVDSAGHFGSRTVFGQSGRLYMTTGDRQFKNFGVDHVSQDRTNELGAVLRLRPDGSIPEDNPFVGDEAAVDSLYSYGHRNPQGLMRHPETGDIWETEHGERDGDEINRLQAGGNYGWPVASTACNYGTDDPVGDDHFERDDVVAPVYYWECGTGGFPPAGGTFYDGDAFPNWQGDLFVGNLAGAYLGRLVVTDPGGDPSVTEADPLLDGRDWRIRDVTVAPDTGHLYVAVDADGGPIVRLVPA